MVFEDFTFEVGYSIIFYVGIEEIIATLGSVRARYDLTDISPIS